MSRAIALANNDVVFLAWRYDQKIANCLGFAVYRTDCATNQRAVLTGLGRLQRPIRMTTGRPRRRKSGRFKIWLARFHAERGHAYEYEIVPMIGAPGSLRPCRRPGRSRRTGSICCRILALFGLLQRGILSTQALARGLPRGRVPRRITNRSRPHRQTRRIRCETG